MVDDDTRRFYLWLSVLDSAYEERRLVDHAAAFGAYAECDERPVSPGGLPIPLLVRRGVGKHMTEPARRLGTRAVLGAVALVGLEAPKLDHRATGRRSARPVAR